MLLVPWERVQRDLQVLQAKQVLLEILVHWVQERLVLLVKLVIQVPQVLLELQDLLAKQVPLDKQVLLVQLEQQGLLAKLVLLATLV